MFPQWLNNTKALAVDCETGGLSIHAGHRPYLISFTSYEGQDFFIRWSVEGETRLVKNDEAETREIQELLLRRASKNLTTIFHNANFDLQHIFSDDPQLLLHLQQLYPSVRDTVILSHCANPNQDSYKLKPLCLKLCGHPIDDESDLQSATKIARRAAKKLGWKLGDVVAADYWMAPEALCARYAVGDTQRTMKLYKLYEPLLEAKEGIYKHYREQVELEHQVAYQALLMNLKGVCVDLPQIRRLRQYYSSFIEDGKSKLASMGLEGFNPRSPKQKIHVFGSMGISPENRKRKNKDGSHSQTPSLDKKVLAKLAPSNDLASVLLEMGEAEHQLNSFINPFEELSYEESGERILHPNFNSVGPRTGRMSCFEPNLQNITSETSPGKLSKIEFLARTCFKPRKGFVWMLADYSQVEVWIAAYASQEPRMKEILERGDSIHDLTNQTIFGKKPDFEENKAKYRKLSKIVTFSLFYGSGPKALSALLGVTYDEAKEIYQRFWDTYCVLKGYADRLAEAIERRGYVQDCFGKTYFLDKQFGYKALNFIIQGTAGGILKRALAAVGNLRDRKYPFANCLMAIHDELIIEIPKEEASYQLVLDVVEAMQGDAHKLLGIKKPLPLEVAFVKDNWGKKIKYPFL